METTQLTSTDDNTYQDVPYDTAFETLLAEHLPGITITPQYLDIKDKEIP